MTRAKVLSWIVGIGVLSITVTAHQGQQAQQKAPPPLPELTRVRDNLYIIGSSGLGPAFTGGNTAVFIMEKGVAIVDTKIPGYGPTILDRIRAVTPKPVTTIINTHTHFDHTGSNPGFPATVEIVTHENTKSNMEKMDAFKGAGAPGLPKRTFKDRLTLFGGKDAIELHYFGAAHTNGDTFVYFPALRTLHAGDVFPWKDAPFIDRGNGGSGVALPATLSKLLAGIKDIETVIPGHIPPTTRADLEEFQRYTAELLAAAQAAKKAGQSAAAAAKSMTVTGKFKGYTAERLAPAVEAIYADLP
jgi:glyoxylase-like metal-dependent hydrolase (beta-lactamase superfamily II)